MNNNILGRVALGYSPLIDRSRAVTATRLTVFPLRPDLTLDVAELLHAVGSVWPENGGRVSLNVLSESLLQNLLQAQPSCNLMVEVPSFMVSDPDNVASLQRLHAAGSVLLIKGRPVREIPREVLPCFTYSIVDLSEDRRLNEASSAAPEGVVRSIPHVQAGVRTLVEMENSFTRGAAAVLGWPIDDAISQAQTKSKTPPADIHIIMELIRGVDAQEPIEKLELTLKRDPSLAFKLMRYINSPAFGLRVEISSFRHALMMLGYQRLKRWLALLLATAGKDTNMKPVMFAAVRRGLLMEELVRSSGDDEMRNEMFICGVFSLLDRMFKQPFSELLKTIPVPPGVFQALVEETGPYYPYFKLVQAVENESVFDFRTAAEALMLSVSEINRAVLSALTSAAQVD
ncbi:MAG TPA: HDOD domain-containing protein [Rhizobacter sp.]|nr:HDOD domain-containing protein [Rhizobacter sp.]